MDAVDAKEMLQEAIWRHHRKPELSTRERKQHRETLREIKEICIREEENLGTNR